jgi:hypothetical protein
MNKEDVCKLIEFFIAAQITFGSLFFWYHAPQIFGLVAK